MKHFFKHIATKLFVAILLMIIPINIFIFILNNRVIKVMQEEIHLSVESILENQNTMLESRMGTGSYMLWHMRLDNSNAADMLSAATDTKYMYSKSLFNKEIKQMVSLSDGMDAYFYYNADREDLMIWDTKDDNDAVIRELFYSVHDMEERRNGWDLKTIQDKELLYLYNETGSVVCGGVIYLDTLRNQIQEDIKYEKDFMIFTTSPSEDMDGYQRIACKGARDVLYLSVYLEDDEVSGKIIGANFYVFVGSWITLLTLPLLYMLIRRWLVVPLKDMNRAFKKVEDGNLDYRITKTANTVEYEESYHAFNAMVDHIQALKIENYEKELEREKMELNNLQLQIRPHFLLNTFSLIYTLAQRREHEAIQEIILYLSDYFRYLFRSGKNLELFQKEQKLIEGYVRMAMVRYPNSIEIDYDYDPEIMFVRIPPLLLHNYVENIVKHVVKPGKVTHISIVGQYEDNIVTFMVMDDGQGISEERLMRLEESMKHPKSDGKHVGFSNSYKRIKYFYGDEADISITSVENEGTCITITFPYEL